MAKCSRHINPANPATYRRNISNVIAGAQSSSRLSQNALGTVHDNADDENAQYLFLPGAVYAAFFAVSPVITRVICRLRYYHGYYQCHIRIAKETSTAMRNK